MAEEEKLDDNDLFVRKHYEQMGEEFEYIHGIDAMQCLHPYELLNAIDFVDDYNYVIPSFTMTEHEIRKHYECVFHLDPDDPSKDHHLDIIPETEEEGRIYRKIFKNPESANWIFVQKGEKDKTELTYEVIMVYEPGSSKDMALKFTEALLNHFFNYKKFRTFKEIEKIVQEYRSFADRRASMNPFELMADKQKYGE